VSLEELATHLQTAGVGTVGKTIFAYHMPENPAIAIVFLPELEGAMIHEDLPNYRTEIFRVIVRHNNHVAGLALANQVSNALDLHNTVVGTTTYKRLRPTTDPIPFPVSEGDRIEFLVSMWAAYVIA